MRILNVVIVSGRMVSEPELRRTANGSAVISFSVACERDVKSKSTGEKETDFIECSAWMSTAEFISKYFNRGDNLSLVGRLEQEHWTAKDGSKRSSMNVVVDRVYFGSKKQDAPSKQKQEFTPSEIADAGKEFSFLTGPDPDLPF